MTRHSRNATAGPTYTYHEKNKDSQQSGYGSKEQRLSKDAIKVYFIFIYFSKTNFVDSLFNLLINRNSTAVRSLYNHAKIRSLR